MSAVQFLFICARLRMSYVPILAQVGYNHPQDVFQLGCLFCQLLLGGYRVLVCCARSHGQPRSAESSSEAKLFALDPVDWKPWQWVEEGKSGRDVQGVWLTIHSAQRRSSFWATGSHDDCHAQSFVALLGRRGRHWFCSFYGEPG